MLTITHGIESRDWHYVTVTNPDYQTYYNFAIADYAIGRRKPNYPMPAIPLRVIWPWEWSDIDQTNQEYVTLIRATDWNEHTFEGTFANEWCVYPR